MRRLCLALLAAPLLAGEPFTTPSGLKIETLSEGKPDTAPKPGDRVKVHYTGRLADGTQFDSSLDRGAPIEFVLGVGMVIAGWDEGLALMNVGSKCRLTIPWNLAYGEEGRGKIPPRADLVFEVEIVEVTKGEPPPAFRPANAGAQRTTESGLKWEVLEEGSGDRPKPDDVVKLRFTVWTAEGRIALSSLNMGPLTGPAGAVQLRFEEKFLPEAVQLMRVGAKCRFEVPAALCWGGTKRIPAVAPDATTVWQLELEEIVRFAKPDPEKARKTESGLEYEIVREGTGAAPGAHDQVFVHYTGWFEDGREFDSSHRRGQSARFAVNGVIPGWSEGLRLMKEGGICRFRIPPDLAYGERGQGPVPPNATLYFEVELLRVLRR